MRLNYCNSSNTDLGECSLVDTIVSATQSKKNREEDITEKIANVEKEVVSVLGKEHHHEEIILKEKEEKKNYLVAQRSIILTQEERKILWNEYKNYVDKSVFIEIQFATLCR